MDRHPRFSLFLQRWPNRWRYWIALFVVCATIALKAQFQWQMHSPFLFSALCILLCSWYGGFGPGLVSSIVLWAGSWYLFTLPAFGIERPPLGPTALKMAYILCEWIFISAICAKLRQLADQVERDKCALQRESLAREGLHQELQAHEAQMSLVMNALPNLIAYVDANERLLFFNKACVEWYDLPEASLAGAQLRTVVGEHAYELSAAHRRSVLAGRTVRFEIVLQRAQQQRTLAITYLPDLDQQGRVKGFIKVGSDITEQKQTELDLIRAKEKAESANAAKSAFLANMSHEIRTPMGAILGFSELIADSLPEISEKAAWLDAIRRNSALLSNIINDILDLSKVEAGKLEVERRSVELTEILTDLGEFLRLQASEKGITLYIDQLGQIPRTITTDGLRLRQILLNIVGNAIKFTSRGEVRVNMRLVPGDDGRTKLAFVVSDTGLGIKEAEVQRLFEAFNQADFSTTRKFGGTGLGLVLSKKLATALGGDVILTHSKVGVGSTFTVTIDPGEFVMASPDKTAEAKLVKLEATRPSDNKDLFRNMRLLLVEDSEDNQLFIQEVLRRCGAEVKTAGNGKEGVEKALASDFDLVLMDLQMPIMDGYQATSELRRHGYKKPIIALTAFAMRTERDRCLSCGFDDHLSKPINRELLMQRICDLTANRASVLH